MKKFVLFSIMLIFIWSSTFSIDPSKDPSTQSISIQQDESFDKKIYEGAKNIAEVFTYIKERSLQKIDPKESSWKALDALVKNIDPHSAFLDPESYKKIIETTQGEFYGIGVVIDNLKKQDDEFLKIIEIIPAGPADKGGLRAEDKIIQVDNQTLKGLSVDEIIAKIKGEKDTKVSLKVIRPGNTELMHFNITRDIVKDQNALCYHMPDNNIAYLSLNMFTENAVKQLENLLKHCISQDLKGIILDLRNNTGGLLNVTIDIAGMFLPADTLVVVTKDKNQKTIESYSTTRQPICTKPIPIFILINNYTASAAEILAGCLQMYAQKGLNNIQVFLVGTKTFGKGSVQEVIPLSNNCALKLTTGEFRITENECVQGKGINPDFEIQPRLSLPKDVQWFTNTFGYENTLKNSIKTQDQDKKPEDNIPQEEKKLTWQEKKEEQIQNDYQILTAVRLIELYHLLRKAYPDKCKNHLETVEVIKKVYISEEKIVLKEIKMEAN